MGGHDYLAMLDVVTAAMNPAPDVVVLRGEAGSHTPYPALLGQRRDTAMLPPLDPDAVRMVLYTSGTTGRPKGDSAQP